MMSVSQINQMSADAAVMAALENKTPFVMYEGDVERMGVDLCKKIPNLGDLRPEGFEMVDHFMVDSSGLGAPGEPALTIPQFLERVKPDYGYAIIEEGQFQIVIGEFQKDE